MDDPALASAAFWLSWLDPIKFWAEVGVAVCLSVGVLAAFFAAQLAKRISDARELELTRLQNDTQQLSTEAETARSQIADANARALEAQAALEKYKAPRVLTGEQIASLADKLRPLAGQAYDLSLPRMLEPGAAIHTQLIAALHKAGWKLQSFQGSGLRAALDKVATMFAMDLPATTSGTFTISIPRIEIGVSDGMIGILAGFEPGDSLEAHGKLLEALRSVEVEAGLISLGQYPLGVAIPPKATPTTLHLIIGSKN